MIQLPDDAEYARLTRSESRPVRAVRDRVRPGARTVAGAAPTPPVDTAPPPGWEPSPESRAAMDELLPPMRPEPEPGASADARTDSDWAADVLLRSGRAAIERALDDTASSAAEIRALTDLLFKLSGGYEAGAAQPDSGPRTLEIVDAEVNAAIEERARAMFEQRLREAGGGFGQAGVQAE